MIFNDPIVSAVRAAGRKLEEKCDGDPNRFIEMLQADEEKLQKEGWKLVGIGDMGKPGDLEDAAK